jgi:hypothetical protein
VYFTSLIVGYSDLILDINSRISRVVLFATWVTVEEYIMNHYLHRDMDKFRKFGYSGLATSPSYGGYANARPVEKGRDNL